MIEVELTKEEQEEFDNISGRIFELYQKMPKNQSSRKIIVLTDGKGQDNVMVLLQAPQQEVRLACMMLHHITIKDDEGSK